MLHLFIRYCDGISCIVKEQYRLHGSTLPAANYTCIDAAVVLIHKYPEKTGREGKGAVNMSSDAMYVYFQASFSHVNIF